MKKDLAIIFGLFLLIVVLLIFGKGFSTASYLGLQNQTQQRKDSVSVSAKALIIQAKIVTSPGDRKKGLSGLDSLPLNQGMLFVFENKGTYGFWMKDMEFAIDIIWIDENKNIVDIVENAAPQPGKKEKELTVYKPRNDALYVLEVNAGLSNLNNLQIGDKVAFEL
ncbi:hypothetical protein A3B52_00190 [Candidatus Curtissbacteria bacterium RIFCSPLOWO2_01_FULL_41_28]|nr:MAG: hypothetical protein A3B52_00190 [Candidatus Curtissbacteria bacterium RIFCSPLOWO2_01_FULL_41_28]OGE18112.1 MAG: hypothetical protein A2495_03580 [Candidatus Curtissbacteria bacterium RIFOXYC12_FULL_41_11]